MPRLWLRKLTSIGAVPEGDNPEAAILLYKAKRDFPPEARENMAEQGEAMPDGSFPIPDKDALRRAVASFGRADNPAAVRAHIMRRARALGAEDMLPEGWEKSTDKGMVMVETVELVKEAEVAVEISGENVPQTEVAATEDGDETSVEKRIADAESEIQKARAERDAALSTLAEEVRKQRTVTFVAKARELEVLLGPADDTAPVLEVLEGANPEAFVGLEKALRTALTRLNLTKDLGTTGDEGASPMSRRDSWVRKYVLDHPEITVEKARALFWKANPDALEAQHEEIK